MRLYCTECNKERNFEYLPSKLSKSKTKMILKSMCSQGHIREVEVTAYVTIESFKLIELFGEIQRYHKLDSNGFARKLDEKLDELLDKGHK